MVAHLVTINGTIATVNDIFTHTLAIDSTEPALTLAQSVALEFETLWAEAGVALGPAIAPTVTYTHVTAAEILNLAAADPQLAASSRADFDPVLVGAAGGTLPPNVTVAVSLTAGTYANGTPIRGRFYLPVPGNTVNAQGLVAASFQQDYLDWASAFLDRLLSVGNTPCVWSRKIAALSPVTSVRVGDRFDTMRSRDNSAGETYLSSPVPAST